MASSLLADVKDLEPGSFLLLEGAFQDIADDTGVKAHISEIPEFRATREHSAQGVYFGQLVLGSESQTELTEFVAVKPYDHPRGAVREAVAMNYINNIEPLRRTTPIALTTLGFYNIPDSNKTGLLTLFEQGIRTQDNIFWDPNHTPGEREVIRALNEAALTLGALHRYGWKHGDAQAKNEAKDRRGLRVIDMTDAAMIGLGYDDAKTREAVLHDVDTYIASLNRIDPAHLINMSPEGVEAVVAEMNSRNYTEAVMDVFAPLYMAVVASPGREAEEMIGSGISANPQSRIPEAVRLHYPDIRAMAEARYEP